MHAPHDSYHQSPPHVTHSLQLSISMPVATVPSHMYLCVCPTQEDPDVVERRKVVRELFDKVKMAIDDVQYMQEKIKRKDEDGETVRRLGACRA